MSEINNLSLQAFAEILRNGSFEAAARKLHITPSAVSQRIRQLEEQFGQLLIIRGSPSRPTIAGSILYNHAQQVQLLEDDLFNELKQTSNYEIAVAVNTDSIDGWFLDAMTVAARSGIMLNIKVEDQEFSESLLREGKVMAAVSTNSKPMQGCSTEYLGTMYYTAYASDIFYEKYFSAGDRVENLISSPSIFFNEKDGLQRIFLKSVAGRDAELTAMFIPSNAAYVEAILRGMGWGMLPEHMSSLPRCNGKIVKLFPDTLIAVNLYWHRWSIRISALDRLSRYVFDSAERQLKKVSIIKT